MKSDCFLSAPHATSAAAEPYSEWLRRQGDRVIQTRSSFWHSEGHGVYQAFPHHWQISPSESELKELFFEHRARVLRYSSDATCNAGCASFQIVCDDKAYGLSSLSASTRRNVRDGLKKCRIEPISIEYLVKHGWPLARDTENRQERNHDASFHAWVNSNRSAADLSGFETWGAFVDKTFAAFLFSFQMGNCCYMLYQRSLNAYLKDHVNHAILFSWMTTMFQRPGVTELFNGMESLDGPDSLTEFKLRMGYRKRIVRQVVAIHPWFVGTLHRPAQWCLSLCASLYPTSRTVSKAAGLLKFAVAARRSS